LRDGPLSSSWAVWFAVLVGALGTGLLIVAFTGSSSGPGRSNAMPVDAGADHQQALGHPQPPVRHKRPVRRIRAGVEDLIAGPVLPQSRPVSLSIPRLHVSSRLVPLGVDNRGAMEVPQDPATAGWYDLGPTPGALGPAVIAGHVTWNDAPAIFEELASMRKGDDVEVAREDGRLAVFRVSRVARFGKSVFPTRVVFGGADHAGLRLITCGGAYDESARRYPDNVVVFAALVSSRPMETQRTR
jgi:hypothetical protein